MTRVRVNGRKLLRFPRRHKQRIALTPAGRDLDRAVGPKVAPELSAPPPVRYTDRVRVRSCLAAVLAVTVTLIVTTAPAAVAGPATPPAAPVTTLDPASVPEPPA